MCKMDYAELFFFIYLETWCKPLVSTITMYIKIYDSYKIKKTIIVLYFETSMVE